MKARHVVRLAVWSLGRARLRMALAILGIVVGIACVVAMVSLGEGAVVTMRQQLQVLGRNVIIVTPGSITRSGLRAGMGSTLTLVPSDVDAMRVECPSVALVSPGVLGSIQAVFENRNRATTLVGVSVDYFAIRDWDVGLGRVFDASDEERADKVCVLGDKVARSLFPDAGALGNVVRLGAAPFRVIGVLAPKGHGIGGQDQDDVIMVPWTTGARRVMGVRHLNIIIASARSAAMVAGAALEVAQLLRRRHGTRPDEPEDFAVKSLSEVQAVERRIAEVMMKLIVVVALAAMGVGGIGVMNIMLVSVLERTREIGLRMAVGARPRQVMLQFLAESVILTSLGGLAGVLLGAGTSVVIPLVFHWQTRLTVAPIVASFVFSAMVGIIFGMYPAIRASRMDPIEALRCE